MIKRFVIVIGLRCHPDFRNTDWMTDWMIGKKNQKNFTPSLMDLLDDENLPVSVELL